jgi:hypothetical protein
LIYALLYLVNDLAGDLLALVLVLAPLVGGGIARYRILGVGNRRSDQ